MKSLMIMIVVLLTGCASNKITSSKHLVLEEAFQRSFVKGKQNTEGSNSGTNYSMIFNKYEGCEIEGVWLFNKEMDFEATEHEGLLYVIVTRYSEISIDLNPTNAPVPMEYEGKALIAYNYDGKTKYLAIADFEVKEMLNSK